MHPTKREIFDTEARLNIDPKGFERPVDTYRETDFGLYMARGADHPDFGYLESWLIPQLNLRANIFHFRPGAEKHQDFYFDIAEISRDGSRWHTRDLYVDLVSLSGIPLQVLDIDELAEATSQGYIAAEEAERAIEATLNAVEGITRHHDDAMAWLRTQGIQLDWARPEDITLTPPM